MVDFRIMLHLKGLVWSPFLLRLDWQCNDNGLPMFAIQFDRQTFEGGSEDFGELR